MKTFTYKITDESGIHARPAGMLTKEAKKYESKVTLSANGRMAEARKLLAIMGMGVACGDEVKIEISGEDEEAAYDGMRCFFEDNL